MDALERRQGLLRHLQNHANTAINGTLLARQFSVSRQIIVQDIALLRAEGHQILATPQGYLMLAAPSQPTRVVACVHNDRESMERELMLIVGLGVMVLDVIVEHAIYGEIKGLLMIRDAEGVADFLERLRDAEAQPLSALTAGVHLHTLQAATMMELNRAEAALREAGILVENE